MSIICYWWETFQRLCPLPRIRRNHLILFFGSFTSIYLILRTNIGISHEGTNELDKILINPDETYSTVEFVDSVTNSNVEFVEAFNETFTLNDWNETSTMPKIYNSSSSSTNYLRTTPSKATLPTISYLDLCPEEPPSLVGKIRVPSQSIFYRHENLTKLMQTIENENNGTYNGLWYPKNCRSIQNLALIIPYRNRSEHLAVLLKQLHSILKRQQTYYQIFVVEQFGDKEFNKARLMNIAFNYINSSVGSNFNCFIFHDVDLIPENDKNLYRCNKESPRHLSPAVSTLRYRLPYNYLIGGVLAITPEIFGQVNGYSNLYWGWGGEDDDMFFRIEAEKLNITRPSLEIGRYKMIRHKQREGKESRMKLVWSAKERYKNDGLAQIHTFNYTIVFVKKYILYTHIMIDEGSPPSE